MSDRKGSDRSGRREKGGDAGSVGLPRFGLASDVLGRLGDASDPTDPKRIYAFADELEAAQPTPSQPTGPAPRFETWVTFGLAAETYALPVAPVREVLRVTAITRVPHAPEPIRGVTQHRGRVIPVIDLRLRLGLEAAEAGRQGRLLVVASRQRRLGLLVDRVFQVMQLDLNRAQAPPEDVVDARSDFVTSVYNLEDDLLLMLDVDRVLVVRDQEDD